MLRKLLLVACLCLPPAVLLGPGSSVWAANPPPDFIDTPVASEIWAPTQLEMTPDGRLIVLEDAGRALLIKDDQVQPTPFFDIRAQVDDVADRGLLSITLDNDFAVNGYVYVVYTFDTNGVDDGIGQTRLSRFTVNGDVAGNEVVLFDRFPDADVTLHYGGAVVMGPDGKLYVAIGDHLLGANGQDTTNLEGSVIRLNPDGTIPTDNPFYDQFNGDSRAIYAYGLRNPWQMSKSPVTGQVLVHDVGSDEYEELNELEAGANYGWFLAEGDADPANPDHAGFTDPLWAYPHFGVEPGAPFSGCAVIGGSFYEPASPSFPVEYHGKYFTGDYCTGQIVAVDPALGTASVFMDGFVELVDMEISPTTGELYYLDRSFNGDDQFPKGGVGKISFAGDITQITITTQPSDVSIAAGGTASFFVGAASPGDVSYQWQRDGSDVPGATSPNLNVAGVGPADDGAVFTVRISDGATSVLSDPATLSITNNTVPQPVIVVDDVGAGYQAGVAVGFTGSATDAEDGTIPPDRLRWEIRLNHDDHDHGLLGPFTGAGGSFVVPSAIETSPNVWVTIYLTATDSDGTSWTTSAVVAPHIVDVTLASAPDGATVRVDGDDHVAPHTFQSVVGVARELGAPSPQIIGGVAYEWQAWSDGGARDAARITPAADATYTATFALAPTTCTISPLDGGGIRLDWTDEPGTEIVRNNDGWVTTPPAGTTFYEDPAGNADDGWFIRRTRGQPDEPCTGDVPPPPPPPPPPDVPCLVSVSGAGVLIEWEPIAGENRYHVRVDGGSWIATVNDTTSYQHDAGDIATPYLVRYNLGAGNIDIGCVADGDPPPPPPPPPPPVDGCTVQAEPGGGIRLTWTDEPGTEIIRNDFGWVITPPPGTTSYVDTGGSVDDGWLIRRTRGQPDEVCAVI